MLFNSLEFLIFLITIFTLYWFVIKKLNAQNILVLVASYFFYGWWDWRFLLLILFSTLVDYTIGVKIEKSSNTKYRRTFIKY